LYYFGARYYDARTSVWQSVDPLWFKYPSWSPYNYAFYNPVGVVDLDGREGIIVAGNHRKDKAGEDLFVRAALYKASKLQKQYNDDCNGQKVTLFIPKGFVTQEFQEKAEGMGIKGSQIRGYSATQEIVDYVNEKNGGKSRENDLITRFDYLGHGSAGQLPTLVGKAQLLDIGKFDRQAFSENASCLFGSCRSADPAKGGSILEKALKLTNGVVMAIEDKGHIVVEKPSGKSHYYNTKWKIYNKDKQAR